MCTLLGIDVAYETDLSHHCSRIGPIVSFDVANRLVEITDALAELSNLLEAIVDSPVTTSDAPIRMLTERASQQLSWEELVGLLVIVLFSGHEALRFQLGSAIEHLADAPQQWATLCADRALVPNAATECLRFDPVFPAAARVATEGGIALAGLSIDEGTMVFAFTGAANRDPAVFANPDSFDITAVRTSSPLVFGAGPHYCLGAALGSVTLEAMLDRLAGRGLTMEVAGPVQRRTMIEGQSGPESLPVHFGAS
jgi:cytochrome P450